MRVGATHPDDATTVGWRSPTRVVPPTVAKTESETDTVIKRILPYLRRRGYEDSDIDFETAIERTDRYGKGYVDLLIKCGKSTPQFLIEAKRNGKTLTAKDRNQAISYGRSLKTPFVVVTNGQKVELYNTNTEAPLHFDGRLARTVPTKDQLPKVMRHLRANKMASDVPLNDSSLPYRPAVPLQQLNALFSRCLKRIRNIEKNEENAFADFSKLLFLRLLEEKAETSGFTLPYSYRFYELAEKTEAEADQVRDAITTMIEKVRNNGYGDVLSEPLHLSKAATFWYLVQELSRVSFMDSALDTKGAAFEYFVRTTLKGKHLGQYFTPRPLVDLMMGFVGREAIAQSLLAGQDVKVLDPACGTGGFLVFLLKATLASLDTALEKREITFPTHKTLVSKAMGEVFYGADANRGVAAAAKMNMIIAGDGHTNIYHEDTLRVSATVWSMEEPKYDFILTNPPFGTSERASLPANELNAYPVSTAKGQLLFLQRMVQAVKRGGYVCTVIDEGVLNNDKAYEVRKWVLERCQLLAVVRLPDETFKPNKINVRSSVLLLRRKTQDDPDLCEAYPVTFCDLHSLGYTSSGDPIRKFAFDQLRTSLDRGLLDHSHSVRNGYEWDAFDVQSTDIAQDRSIRMDYKYWLPSVRSRMEELRKAGAKTIGELNQIKPTARGYSPKVEQYVDETDGYALVVKAGTNISPYGELIIENADYIEKFIYDDVPDKAKVQVGDVLLSSTGTGTLGKVCVYDHDRPTIADGHVTIIRCDPGEVDPHYLAGYLRYGFGQDQIQRLYTGSTGLIELPPSLVDKIVVELPQIQQQREMSAKLRDAESDFRVRLAEARAILESAQSAFRNGVEGLASAP
jgi:type I restriction enzyme M protein